jgi:AraC family transcriptional regulator, transcriptional activator of the genes for pyochelin and ferripyochelin receptors
MPSAMKKQAYFPTDKSRVALPLSTMGLDHPEGTHLQQGRSWLTHQACRHATFSLVAMESYFAGRDWTGYTRQEDYIKISFWLSGKHTTVLDGYGQHDHDGPEIFVTAGPSDMIKLDLMRCESPFSIVSLCLLRDFFPVVMGLDPHELPEPLRALALADEKPYALHSYSLTSDIVAAARAIVAAPAAVRMQPLYGQAKAIELMCLLLNRINTQQQRAVARSGGAGRRRRETCLREARQLLAQHYAEPITLEWISRQVGLNKMSLTSGFREMFGMSVYDCLHKERMQHAYELLQDEAYTIAQVAEAVGYAHSCNFSTAFRAHFGCTPQNARGQRRT